MLRFDRAPIKSKYMTDEGFLSVRGIATRTGVFKYRNVDGTIRRELRHPDDVLKADSLNTMKGIPVTLLHPKERKVDSTNASKLSVGYTGDDVNHDGRLIDVNLKVTDQKAIDTIENGTQELSLGYQVTQVDEQGTFNGEKYDCRQTDIKYNHLAIVPAARAGNEAKLILDEANLRLDEDDAVHFIEDDNNPNNNNHKPKELNMNLVKMTLDNGIEYDAAPEVKVAHDALSKKATTAETNLDTKTKEVDTLQAKLDVADEKVKAFEKNDGAEIIATAVNARLALVNSVIKHLNDEESKDIAEKTDAQIKELVIKKYSPELNLDGKSVEYIEARFDAALENEVKEDSKDKGIGSQRLAMKNNTDSDSKEVKFDAEESRKKMVNDLTNNWKPESK